MRFYTWWGCRSSGSSSPCALIGVVAYREHLSARHVVGLLMCLGGLVLAARP